MIKIFKIIYYVLLGFVVVIALFLLVSALPITGNFKLFVVQSGSMEPSINTGGLIMVKPVDEYAIGDVVSFGKVTKTKDPTTHRIHDIRVVSGEVFYITKGDANNAPDQKEIREIDIVGKVLFDIPYLGYAIDFAKKPIGFALIIIIPAVAIIIDEIKKIFKEVKKKKVIN